MEVDMNGEIVWGYSIPSSWVHGQVIVGFDAQVLPDNHVLITISGSGIYEIDRSGNLVWSESDPKVSHDSDRLSNGNTIYVFGNNDETTDASVKEVDSNGTLVWSWRASDYYSQRYPSSQYSYQGYAHTNAAQRLSDNTTLISLRNFDLTAIVAENGSVVKEYDWNSFGADVWPHEPQVYEDDNTLVVCLQDDSHSVMVEVDRENGSTIRTYENLNLRTTRDADRRPNGNYLIVSVDIGGTIIDDSDDTSVIFEITPQGETVWQLDYKNAPIGHNPGWFFKAQRMKPQASIETD